MITAAALFLLGAVLGWTACHLDAHGWACHGWARMRGGTWFEVRQDCPGCGRRVHVMRRGPLAASLCTGCSSGRAHSDGHAAPDRTETGRATLASLLGHPEPQDAAEGRTDHQRREEQQ